jgi:hypothetical protein
MIRPRLEPFQAVALRRKLLQTLLDIEKSRLPAHRIASETIGKIDDLLVTRDGKEPRFCRQVDSSQWAPTWWSCGMTASKIGLSTRDLAPKF